MGNEILKECGLSNRTELDNELLEQELRNKLFFDIITEDPNISSQKSSQMNRPTYNLNNPIFKLPRKKPPATELFPINTCSNHQNSLDNFTDQTD